MKNFSALSNVVLIVIFALSVSCKKERVDKEPEPLGYYMKFKVDGVQKQFTNTEGLIFRRNVYGNHMMYGSAKVDINTYPFIQFDFSNTNDIFHKNFVFTNKVSSDTLGFMGYNEGLNYTNLFQTLSASASKFGATDFVFSLTERTSTYVRGSFSGTIYRFFGGTTESKKITEGQFYLKSTVSPP